MLYIFNNNPITDNSDTIIKRPRIEKELSQVVQENDTFATCT